MNWGEMRISRLSYLVATAALAAAVIAPATASALLTNQYGQTFAGTAVCQSCHDTVGISGGIVKSYADTTHGNFAFAGAQPSATSTPGTGMWPAGRINAGSSLDASEVAFTLGAGTGLREYVADAAKVGFAATGGSPFAMVNGLEWDPSEPTDFEYALDDYNPASNGISFGQYSCGQCHQVGWTAAAKKPVAGNFATSPVATQNTWAYDHSLSATDVASYIPGASIQCERCHGTGLAASSAAAGAHWGQGIKVVGFGANPNAQQTSGRVLLSQDCGQCHGSFKTVANTGIQGYTPDQLINLFEPLAAQYSNADVPSEAAFLANPAAFKFFPNGQNFSLKHVYYTEWAMSAHSHRARLSITATQEITPFDATGASHFTAASANNQLCDRCHTGEGYLQRRFVTSDSAAATAGVKREASIMANFTPTGTNEGFLGQECADCHIAHDVSNELDTENGMGVRKPEKASGQFSTKNVAIDNKSICEDCHNWQVETLGQGPIVAGAAVHHPQREVYHARAFLEVATSDWKPATWAAGRTDFMPGAKCEQCHMPATRSDFPDSTQLPRYATQSYKRYSHRMFIMMPGDAKNWGLPNWGDSCSPCHAGETQDQLQANIDTWQSDAAALNADLSTALAAAQTRSESTVLSGAPGTYLYGVGFTNQSIFVADESGGVHNPAYEQGALKKSIATVNSIGGQFTALSAPGTVGANSLFAIAGTIVNGDGSAPMGAKVTLWNGATQVGATTADANGNFSFMLASSTSKTYTVKWERSSNPLTDIAMNARVTVATRLTLTRSVSSVLAGRTFALRGVVSPASASAIRIDGIRPGTTSYRTLGTVTANASTGAYSFSYHTTIRGTWRFRAVFVGTTSHNGVTSSSVTVVVR